MENVEKLDYSKIDNVVMENVTGYPDFSDAYIVSGDYDGRSMTEDEIESLDSDFVYEQALNWYL